MDIWSSLPSTEEVNGTELHKLKEVSPVLMQSCTRVVVGAGVVIAMNKYRILITLSLIGTILVGCDNSKMILINNN